MKIFLLLPFALLATRVLPSLSLVVPIVMSKFVLSQHGSLPLFA